MPRTVPRGWIVEEMCKGCLRIFGNKCLVQVEPHYLYRKYGTCWSKITEPKRVEEIELTIMLYCGRKGVKFVPLEGVLF